MADRIVRDELLDSDRWLWLPSDTDRLIFIGLLLKCDDFGNLEGGSKRLFRYLHGFTQTRSEEAMITSLSHLVDADLIRRYEVDQRELFHVPRFRPHRQYLVRKYPQSPWDSDRKLGKNKRVATRGLAKDQALGHVISSDVATTSLPDSNHLAEGVGVGVGEIQKPSRANSEEIRNDGATNLEPLSNQPKTVLNNLTNKIKTTPPSGQLTREQQLAYVDAKMREQKAKR
jgi:hypothetical protein